MNDIFQKLTELQVWEILVEPLIIIIITLAAYFVLGKIMNTMEKIAKVKTPWTGDEEIIVFLKKPLKRIVLLVGVYVFLLAFSQYYSERLQSVISGTVYILILIQITFMLLKAIGKGANLYNRYLIDKQLITTELDFLPLLVRIAKIIVLIIAVVVVLKHFKQDVQTLVVSLGVGSLAIALAAQETLSNMIAGFAIMTDRPFRVGDRIQLSSGETGDVHQIGLRSTKVLTFDNTLIIVPNAEIIKEKVINLTYPKPITRVVVKVGVAYGSDLAKVKEIMTECAEQHPKVMEEPPPSSYFLDFGESSLDLRVTCFVSDWHEVWLTAEDIRLAIYNRFNAMGIEIPFPQRTLWFANKPGKDILDDKSQLDPNSDSSIRRDAGAEGESEIADGS